MFKDFAIALVTVSACAGVAQAHDYTNFVSGPAAYAYSGYTVSSPLVSVTPVYAAPVVVYQPAYFVPTSISYVTYSGGRHHRAPVGVATYAQGFAPMVPMVATGYVPEYRRTLFRRHHLRPVQIVGDYR